MNNYVHYTFFFFCSFTSGLSYVKFYFISTFCSICLYREGRKKNNSKKSANYCFSFFFLRIENKIHFKNDFMFFFFYFLEKIKKKNPQKFYNNTFSTKTPSSLPSSGIKFSIFICLSGHVVECFNLFLALLL